MEEPLICRFTLTLEVLAPMTRKSAMFAAWTTPSPGASAAPYAAAPYAGAPFAGMPPGAAAPWGGMGPVGGAPFMGKGPAGGTMAPGCSTLMGPVANVCTTSFPVTKLVPVTYQVPVTTVTPIPNMALPQMRFGAPMGKTMGVPAPVGKAAMPVGKSTFTSKMLPGAYNAEAAAIV